VRRITTWPQAIRISRVRRCWRPDELRNSLRADPVSVVFLEPPSRLTKFEFVINLTARSPTSWSNRPPIAAPAHVRFWHKADIPVTLSDVRFWG
jgi:hypothetical protein